METEDGRTRLAVSAQAAAEWARCIGIGRRGLRKGSLWRVLHFTLVRQIIPSAIALLLAKATQTAVKGRLGLPPKTFPEVYAENTLAAFVCMCVLSFFGVLWPGILFPNPPRRIHEVIESLRAALLPRSVRALLGLYTAPFATPPMAVWVDDDESELLEPGSSDKTIRSSRPLRSSLLGGGAPGPCPPCTAADEDTTPMAGIKGRRTVAELWLGSVSDYPNKPAMGRREVLDEIPQEETSVTPAGKSVTRVVNKVVLAPSYSFFSYREVHETVKALGAGLSQLMDQSGAASSPRAASTSASGETNGRAGGAAGSQANGRTYERRHLGIYADTKMEWMQTLLACCTVPYTVPGADPMVVVTAYATLGLDALAYGFELTGTRVVVADEALLPSLAEIINGREVPDGTTGGKRMADASILKAIVYVPRRAGVSKPDEAAMKAMAGRSAAKGGPITVLSFEEVVERGRTILTSPKAAQSSSEDQGTGTGTGASGRRSHSRGRRSPRATANGSADSSSGASGDESNTRAPGPADLAMVMFTSGTTGLPKGVEITHGSLCAGACGIGAMVPELVPGSDDVMIGYLPLAHVLEVAAETAILCRGACIGYASPRTLTDAGPLLPDSRKPRADGKPGPVPTVKGDAVTLQPTIMAGVPAVFDKIVKAVNGKIAKSSPIVRALFSLAYTAKSRALAVGEEPHPIWDLLVFNKIRGAALSSKIRGILSGGGPISEDTQDYISTVFAPCLQGYGLTETCGGATVTWANDPRSGRVGAPVLCCELRLVDWPEGGYVHDAEPSEGNPMGNPRGEVYIGGPAVTKGYYHDPKKTAESYLVDTQGRTWFATGDIAEVHPNGALSIIDRKKDLVKLSHGEYVAVGRVEAVLGTSPLMENIMVHGEGTEAYTIALVVPSPDGIKARLPSKAGLTRAELAADKEVNEALLAEFSRLAKEHGLHKADVPAKVAVLADEWTPGTALAAELLTESLKLKRPQAVKRYRTVLDGLYGRQPMARPGS